MVWSSRKLEESAQSNKCTTFKVNGSFCREQSMETWNKVLKRDLKKTNLREDRADKFTK